MGMTSNRIPSPWVLGVIGRIEETSSDLRVLDLACGAGRHVELLLERGHRVLAVDRDISGLADLTSPGRLETLQFDLEIGASWPFSRERFKAVLVTNYLHRPTLDETIGLIAARGVLIYETFGTGNERFGRPSNPAYLAKPGEIADHARELGFDVEIDRHMEIVSPRPAMVQRVLATNAMGQSDIRQNRPI
jgi:SAM-dependent methyltransferase